MKTSILMMLIAIPLSLFAADEATRAAQVRELSKQLRKEIKTGSSLDKAIRLIDEGADVNFRGAEDSDDDEDDELALLCFAAEKPEKLIFLNLLLDRGAKVNDRDKDWSPLHQAAQKTNIEAIKNLLRAGADVNALAGFELTPLHAACAYQDSTEVLDLLIADGAIIDAVDEKGYTILHAAALHDQVDVIHYLVGIQYELLKAKNNEGRTALHEAARWGKMNAVKALLEEGSDREATDNNGKTPLDLVDQRMYSEVAQILKEFTNASVRKSAAKS